MSNGSTLSWQQAHDALQALEEHLQAAYNNAQSNDVRNSIDSRLDAIDSVLTGLNQLDMTSRTIALSAAAETTTTALNELDSLKAEIQSITDDIDKATQVLNGVDKFLSVVKTDFSIA